MTFVKSGKVKDVYMISESELEFVFTDRISVFDKIIPTEIPYKGETLARTSAFWFRLCRELGIETHYLGLVSPNRMRVRRVRILQPGEITEQTSNYLIPLEWITRYYVYGSLWERVASGKVKPTQLGFKIGHRVSQGERLPMPFLEVTTKLEKTDRLVSYEEAKAIAGLSEDNFSTIRELALQIDREMHVQVDSRGLVHVDGKKEFAFDEKRRLLVVDTFGTADEDRFWDKEELKKGRYVERSKEFVRQYYRKIGYYERLMKAREAGVDEPPIPPLPTNVAEEVSKIYIGLYEDL
ncbi:MAG: phosphoribosylaminoimidazolesuccinocarboxamide synthase, partial [Candidatus Bathyarchaeia archaeon]